MTKHIGSLQIFQWSPTQIHGQSLSNGPPSLMHNDSQGIVWPPLLIFLSLLFFNWTIFFTVSKHPRYTDICLPQGLCMYYSSCNALPLNLCRTCHLTSFRSLLRCQFSARPSLTTPPLYSTLLWILPITHITLQHILSLYTYIIYCLSLLNKI